MDSICNFALLFTREFVILPVFIIGMIFIDRQLFVKAALVTLLTMYINPVLKQLFGIPLASHLGDGFAFPSGHMQVAAAFWGYLTYNSRLAIIKLAGAMLLVLIGVALVHFGYHHWYDIIAALFFAIVTIYLFDRVASLSHIRNNLAALGAFVVVSAVLLFFLITPIRTHHMLALGCAWGIFIGALVQPTKSTGSLLGQLVELIVVSVGAVGLFYLFNSIIFSYFSINSLLNTFLTYFSIGFWIIAGSKLLGTGAR